MKKLLFTTVFALTTTLLSAQTFDTLRYSLGTTNFVGFVAKPKKVTPKTKTIIIVHEWWGLTEYPKNRAKQLAELGFIACCIDMYGDAQVATTPDEAKKLAGVVYADPQLSYDRFMAGYTALTKDPQVNDKLVAAIGYCFGGSVVLNAAKMGAVSFHGGLKGVPVDKEKMKASVLVLHGEADAFVPKEDIEAFKQDLDSNKVDYKFVIFPDATHAFTNPDATENGKKFNMPIAYNAVADKRSFDTFLKYIAKKVKL
jgi:dienelactone hydrolase